MTLPNFRLKIVAKEPTCADATAVLKDTANNTILTEAIPSGATENITAPNATVTLNGGAFISPRSNQTINSELEYLDGVNLGTPAEYTTSGNNIQLNRVSPKLLDIYPSPLLAYSAARLLRAAYHGSPIFRIRRSSDSAETDVFSDINGNVTLSSTVGAGGTLTTWIGSNNGFVVTLYDQSGNARHATNSTGSQQPQIISAGAFIVGGTNNRPVLDFVAANSQRLNLTNAIQVGNEFTSFIVTQRKTAATVGVMLGNTSGSTTLMTPLHFNDNTIRVHHISNSGGGNTIQTAFNNQNFNLYSTRVANTTVNLRHNASSLISGSSTTTGLGNLFNNSIGGYQASQAGAFLAELIVFAADLGSTNTAAIETNINSYYGIY